MNALNRAQKAVYPKLFTGLYSGAAGSIWALMQLQQRNAHLPAHDFTRYKAALIFKKRGKIKLPVAIHVIIRLTQAKGSKSFYLKVRFSFFYRLTTKQLKNWRERVLVQSMTLL